MIIRDLEHLEVASEEVIGGGGWYYYYKKYAKKPEPKKEEKPEVKLVPVSIAKADASADAVGGVINIAKTSTETVAAPGVASSKSSSKAVTIGEFDS